MIAPYPQTRDMNTTQNLTAAQSALLATIVSSPRHSSLKMHAGTRTALEVRGLIKMVDRFPSGTALYSATALGIRTARA